MSSEGPVRDRWGAGLELIETMRWEPGAGFLRFDAHLRRLQGSARTLGFPFDEVGIRGALEQAIAEVDAVSRVRLALEAKGGVRVTTAPFDPRAGKECWIVRIAVTRLHSEDLLVRHKTNRREAYERARAEFPAELADEVILLNERGEACEGTITSLFVEGGDHVFLTPALSCGLLPGILREELLSTGRAREAILTRSDLKDAAAILVGNSLRGLIRARLIDE
jgi:4-amino-4-deoxychorismate lyase